MRARELFDFGACATAWRAASSCVTVRASSVSPLCPRIRSGARPPETKAGVCVSTVSHRRRVGPPGGTQSCGSAAGDGAAGPDPPGQAERLKPIPLNSRHKAWFVLPKWRAFTTYDCNQVSSNPQFIGLVPCPGPRRMDSADACFSDCQRAERPIDSRMEMRLPCSNT
jgi:hypothetical protein